MWLFLRHAESCEDVLSMKNKMCHKSLNYYHRNKSRENVKV